MIDLSRKSDLQFYPISEGAVTIEFGETIDEDIVNRVNAFDRLLHQKALPGMYQTVPAYTSLTVFFDLLTLLDAPLPGNTGFDKARTYLLGLNEQASDFVESDQSKIITIPVCYGDVFGDDLEYIAGYTKLNSETVIKLHSEAVYKVCMVGFIPGFAYLGGLNPLLEIPRKATPAKVSPGAVGIAGCQTGIYPLETPGGWQIIGRTPMRLFDATRSQPSLLKANDKVKFEPISLSEFEKYRGG
jgi:inhibitor of KinA